MNSISTRFWHAKRLGRKAVAVAPLIATNPRLLRSMRDGLHPEHYERLNIPWLRQQAIRTVLDIGANTGQFAMTIHTLIPDATVYAFEPQEECVQILKRRFSRYPNLRAICTALGEEDGEIEFHRNTYSQSSSVLPLADLHREAFPWATEQQRFRVPIRRLDSLDAELELTAAMLVKIDVQGYEDRVLRGGERVIRQADYVIVETAFEKLYEGEARFSTVYDLMSTYGFRYSGNLDQACNARDGRPLYADALFVRDAGESL